MVVRRVIATSPPQVFGCNSLFPAMREVGG